MYKDRHCLGMAFLFSVLSTGNKINFNLCASAVKYYAML
jgi:hypothetical protein